MRICFFFLLFFALIGCGKGGLDYGPYAIGRDPGWFPLQIDEQFIPNINAFTNALVQEIGKKEGAPLQVVDIGWTQIFEALEEGEVGGIFTSLTPNVITQERYTFSEPFLLLGPVLIVPARSEANSLEDLKGKFVAVNQYDESALIVQKYPSIYIELYENMPSVLERLAKGEVDGVLMPTLEAHSLVPNLYPDQLKIVGDPLNNKALRLITLKGSNSALIKNFNRGLKALMSNQKYAALRKAFQLK